MLQLYFHAPADDHGIGRDGTVHSQNLNPGSCGHSAGSAGVIETGEGRITRCYLVKNADLEDLP